MPDTTQTRIMMVDTQIRPSDVTKFPIIDAMLTVERERFVPGDRTSVAYTDAVIPLAPERVVADPRGWAKLLDALDLERNEAVLIVGAGLGYGTAVVAQMVDAVIAVEEDPDMAREAEAALSEAGYDNAVIIEAPLTEGAPDSGPYTAIIIEGGVQTVPDALLDQLVDGGRIAAVFMDGPLGTCKIGYKSDGKVSWRASFNTALPVLPGFAVKQDFAL